MKCVIWTVGGVLLALWTGAVATLGLVVDWAVNSLQQAGAAAQPLPADLPGWLGGWVDPAGWAAISQAIQQALQGVQAVLPAVGTAAGWLEPLVWIVWGLGVAALLTVAAGSHWLAGMRADAASGTASRPA